MLTCKEVSRLVSESLDQRLPFGQRVAMRLHLLMCRACRAYKNRMLLLRKILWLYAAGKGVSSEIKLSEKVRDRIKHLLSQNYPF
ncbi:MAG: zf-HC2 domain-containing protein [Verrucomicrobia bacterium]|nr:MAG: zf-HC2 domain-containing protein [Verrucomicrobiota bacterium]